jgi:hypothetical protein
MKTVTVPTARSRSGWLQILAVSLVLPALLAGCVTAGASPTASPASAPTNSPSPTATDSPSASPSPTATPTGTPEPTSSLSAAPGKWTGIKWTDLGKIPQLYPANSDAADTYSTVTVFGWSRGYVGFQTIVTSDTRLGTGTMVSTSSPDAVHWTPDRAMTVTGIDYPLTITAVLEGPSGLLAIGRITGAACGGPSTVSAMWTSTDGQTWSLVTPPSDFASASVHTVDGGSAGFIATGILKDGATQAVWLSSDGRAWRQGLLPESTFGDVIVQGGSMFGGGYVVSGAVRGDEGCGGYQLLTPSLWWSTDGKGWTRATLTGAAPATDSSMAVTRISDHGLMAVATEWDAVTQLSSEKIWVTSDGRTWRQVTSPSKFLDSTIRTDGRQGLALVDPDANPPATDGPVVVAAVDDDLTVRPLPQTGEVPMASQSASSWNSTMGPAGLLMISSDYSALWLGVPTGR